MRINQSLGFSDQLRQIRHNKKNTMEKLSSGKGINRAGDNAAGLSISVKMNAQVRGISQARRNIKDAMGLLEVAESGLSEISSSLQRMRELAVQASSDVLSDLDRDVIEKELSQIKAQIAANVSQTDFNTHKVLGTGTPVVHSVENRNVEHKVELIENIRLFDKNIHIPNTTVSAYSRNLSENYLKVMNVDFKEDTVSTVTSRMSMAEIWNSEPRYGENQEIVVSSTRSKDSLYKVSANGEVEVYSGTADQNTESHISVDYERDEHKTVFNFRNNMDIKDGNLTLTTTLVSAPEGAAIGFQSDYIFDDYDMSHGEKGFSLSEDGNELMYMNIDGKISRVSMERNISHTIVHEKHESNPDEIVSSLSYNVELLLNRDIMTLENWIELPSELTAFRLGEDNAAFRIYRDDETEIVFWDGDVEKTPDTDDYYELRENRIYFQGSIQGDYKFDFVDRDANRISLNDSIKLYEDMDAGKNLRLQVNGEVIPAADIFFEKRDDVVNYVYINKTANQIELFGDYRLGLEDKITISYLEADLDNIFIAKNIDTYNLTSEDGIKALRIYISGKEISHVTDSDPFNGFRYDSATGKVSILGDARPDFSVEGFDTEQAVDIRYYLGSESDADTTKLKLSILPEYYNLENTSIHKSLAVYRDNEKIEYGNENGFTYQAGHKFITLHGDARMEPGQSAMNAYKIYYVADSLPQPNQNGNYEIRLPEWGGKKIEWYRDLNESIIVSSSTRGQISFNEENGWIYSPEKEMIVLSGDSRPGVGEYITVRYLLGTNEDTDDYDFNLETTPLVYGLSEGTGPKGLRVYVDGKNVEYSRDNGFSVTGVNISLHGESRPSPYSKIEVHYAVDEYSIEIPEKNRINRVYFGEKEILPAEENDGNGYTFKEGLVALVGTALPDIGEFNTSKRLTVKHYVSTDVPIDERTMGYDPYTEEWVESIEAKADIPMDRLFVTIHGLQDEYYDDKVNKIVSQKYYGLNEGLIVFSDALEFPEGETHISIRYDANHVREYEDNRFIFHVGANSGDQFEAKIKSVENLMFTIDNLTLKTRDYADSTIKILDNLIGKISSQRGSIGSIQNRLESAYRNLEVLEENTMSSVSRIEDLDYAKEMVKQVKYSILEQAYLALQVHQMSAGKEILKLIG